MIDCDDAQWWTAASVGVGVSLDVDVDGHRYRGSVECRGGMIDGNGV